jgi:hypothetical protein
MALHRRIKQYRVVAVSIIIYLAFMLESMWFWFENNHVNLSTQSAGVFGSLVLLIGGALRFALENLMNRHYGEDDKNDADNKNPPE